MPTALFINGVFEDVLDEILDEQTKDPTQPHFLQPYSAGTITLLAKEPPTDQKRRTLYLSVTTSLGLISHHAEIVAWRDKRKLGEAELETLNKEIKQVQPNQKDMIYLTAVEGGKKCVNLLSIINLRKYSTPIPASCFTKVKNDLPLKTKKQAGGWSYVEEQCKWMGNSATSFLDKVTNELEFRIRESRTLTSAQRQARLAIAPHKPEAIQVLSRAFRRNADVINEVLDRAKGKCEHCKLGAPFFRASDGTPYLEVHHEVTLADGGDDTVANAVALCPNCHRQKHFGKIGGPGCEG